MTAESETIQRGSSTFRRGWKIFGKSKIYPWKKMCFEKITKPSLLRKKKQSRQKLCTKS